MVNLILLANILACAGAMGGFICGAIRFFRPRVSIYALMIGRNSYPPGKEKQMKTRTIRLLAAALLAAMCLAALAGCGSAPADPAETSEPSAPDGKASETQPADKPSETETEVFPDIEKMDYDYDITVLHYYVSDTWSPWEEIAVDTMTGDILTDDIFDRNRWLQEEYNIRVHNTNCAHNELKQKIDAQIQTGGDDFQMLDTFGFGSGKLMGQFYFQNMRSIPTIDFNNPWWNQDILKAYSIAGYVEFAASDMLLLDKGATSLMVFNQELADELGITDPYQQVRDGDWTIEALTVDMAQGCSELNGDAVMNGEDQWGLACGDDLSLALYVSSGSRFIQTDEEGFFYYSFLEEDSLDIMMDIFEQVMLSQNFFNSYINRGTVCPSFNDGQVLFTYGMAKSTKSLRALDMVYGLVPVPKYDDLQEEYVSWVNAWHDSMFAIMSTAPEPDTIGAALELLGYYSFYRIRSDLYDNVICGRGTRNAESIEMLNILFANRVYDMGISFDSANSFADHVQRNTATGSSSFASLIASHQNDLEKHIADLNDLVFLYAED